MKGNTTLLELSIKQESPICIWQIIRKGSIVKGVPFGQLNEGLYLSIYLSFHTASPPREDYVQVDCDLKSKCKKRKEKS